MRVHRAIRVSAAAATAFALLVVAGTLGDGAPLFPDWIIAPLVVLTLAISGGAVLTDPLVVLLGGVQRAAAVA